MASKCGEQRSRTTGIQVRRFQDEFLYHGEIILSEMQASDDHNNALPLESPDPLQDYPKHGI